MREYPIIVRIILVLTILAIAIIFGFTIYYRSRVSWGEFLQFCAALALAAVTFAYVILVSRQVRDTELLARHTKQLADETKELAEQTRKSIAQAARARRDVVRSENNWKLFEHQIHPGLPGLPQPNDTEYWKWRLVQLAQINHLHSEWQDSKDGITRSEDMDGWKRWANQISKDLYDHLEEARTTWRRTHSGQEATLMEIRGSTSDRRLQAMLDIAVRHGWDLWPTDFVEWLRQDCGFNFLPGTQDQSKLSNSGLVH